MFPEQFKKVMDLVKKTGDRVIILDSYSPEDSCVVMSFDNYSALVAFVPESSIKNTTSKVAPIITNPPAEEPEKTSINLDFSSDSEETENLTDEDLTDKINREILMWKNRDNSDYLGEESKPRKVWQVPAKVKDKTPEV